MNIGFNLLNKSIFKYFPFPWTVSTVHVIVGLVYCVGMYALGFKDASFGRVSAGQGRGGAQAGGRGKRTDAAPRPLGSAPPAEQAGAPLRARACPPAAPQHHMRLHLPPPPHR